MELWHFEFLELGPKTGKSAENRRKLDLSILVFIYFHPRPLVWYVLELVFPELWYRPRWKKTLIQNGPRQHDENKLPHLVQPVSPYKFDFLHYALAV